MSKYIKKTNPQNTGGRPKKKFDEKQWRDFESLCGLQCTKLEICDWFDIEDDTLERLIKEKYGKGFSEIFQRKRNIGKTSLRRKQWKLAETNPAMAIFLGKNYLDQTDKQSIEQTSSVTIIRDDIN